ncbi:endonuclease [Gangjinia marincola]|uniref:Endonuclease n=2 Tax=Gangjinia marincola TaxID=578463 RepID=A0ABP3XP77_9FLAO
MRKLLALILFPTIIFGQDVLINELDADTPGIDNQEFLELRTITPNSSLDGYIVVFFNGSNSGGDSSYFTIDLNGFQTDINGLFLIGSTSVIPFPQFLIAENTIQNGADAVAIYQAPISDFPEGTLATTTNLVDALVYDTSDADDTELLALLGETTQINEGSSNNTNSIQRADDGSYFTDTPTPRQLNQGGGITLNGITITPSLTQVDEGASFTINFVIDEAPDQDLTYSITLDNNTFDANDFTGATTLTIAQGETETSTTIFLVDDALDEGDEVLRIKFENLNEPIIANNNFIDVRIVDNDFTTANFGTPLSPTYGNVFSTQPAGYYDSLDGLADIALAAAIQAIIAEEGVVRAQTYADVIDILKEADQNPLNSNQVWLVYTETAKAKLDFQTTSDNTGTWNREHTYPRSRGGFFSIEEDDFNDGINVFWNTTADSLRHGNSDAHALRAADAGENSSRGNQHYGQYNGPNGNAGSFKGDVARAVLYMELRYNDLSVVNGFPDITGQLGDLATLLDWHRNDPPDDYEINRNNIVYQWQFNRNPLIDQPDLVEYIWGDNIGDTWNQPLSVNQNMLSSVRFYPNPAAEQLIFTGLSAKTQVLIYSIDGKLVRNDYVENQTPLQLNLEKGVYFIQLNTDENRPVNLPLIIK